MENKYSNGKIYKIVDNTNGNIYIGSTIEKLEKRLWKHKSKYKIYLETLYNELSSFKILENNNYYIELLENYPCNNKRELEQKEAEYIEKLDNVNKMIPFKTEEEQAIRQKEYMKKYNREYKEKNREKINKKKIEKIECEFCKVFICRSVMKRHQNTLKCKKFQV